AHGRHLVAIDAADRTDFVSIDVAHVHSGLEPAKIPSVLHGVSVLLRKWLSGGRCRTRAMARVLGGAIDLRPHLLFARRANAVRRGFDLPPRLDRVLARTVHYQQAPGALSQLRHRPRSSFASAGTSGPK